MTYVKWITVPVDTMDRLLAFRPGAHCAPTERDRYRINGTYGQLAPLARDPVTPDGFLDRIALL